MNGKKLISMVVLLAALAGIAVIQNKDKAHTRSIKTNSSLFEGLDFNIATEIIITKEKKTTHLSKENGVWKSNDLYGYPIEFSKLADAIRKTTSVELGRSVRTGNMKDSEFGFGPDALSIEFLDDGTRIAKLDVGDRREASSHAGWANQYFVRNAGETEIYLVDSDFKGFSEVPTDWINREVIDVHAEEIISITTDQIKLISEGTELKLAGIGSITETPDASQAQLIRGVLQHLNCKSITDPSISDKDLGFSSPETFIAKSKDGFIYKALLGKQTGDGRAIRFIVSYEKPNEPSAPAEDAEQDIQDAYQEELMSFSYTCNANLKEVERLNETFEKWTYIIDDSQAQNFRMTRDQLLGTDTDAEEAHSVL